LPYNPNGRRYRLPEDVKEKLRAVIMFINRNEQEKKYFVIRETPEANQWQETYAQNARHWVKENKDSTIEKIWTRSHLHVMRIGCLLAVGRNPFDPFVELSDYHWARNFINYSNGYLAERFNSGLTGDNSDRYTQQQEMKKELCSYYDSEWNEKTQRKYPRVTREMWEVKAIPRAMLQAVVASKYCFKRDRDTPNAFANLVRECELNGWLIRVDPVQCGRWGKTGAVYCVKNPDS